MHPVMEEIERTRERNCQNYEAIARLTGKTIAEIEADTTAPDPDDGERINEISANIGVKFFKDDEDKVAILYNTRTCPPRQITVITLREMLALVALFTDGWCPVCLAEEIPEGSILCDECLENARNMRRLAR